MRFRTYQEAEAFLLSFVNYEAAKKWPEYNTTNFDLERFAALLDRLGAPHRRPGLIHVAGTKGKGSTCALLASILTAAGCTTGLYTSPHLKGFYERIRIDRAMISDEEFAAVAGLITEQMADDLAATAPPAGQTYRTTFEVLTAMAFRYFADENCSAAVIETGLGGRLDATNVLAPELTIITALGLDHQHILGPTLAHIAREKGGIIKPGVPCVVADQTEAAEAEAVPVLLQIAEERGAPIIRPSDMGAVKAFETTAQGSRVVWTPRRRLDGGVAANLPLLGAHQVANLHTVLAAVEALREKDWPIGVRAVREGVEDVRLAGRLEVAGTAPLFVVDAAHCPMSMRATVEAVGQLWPGLDVTVLYSCLSDKNARDILAELAKLTSLKRLIVFPAPSPRACPPEIIAAICQELGLPCSIEGAVEAAMTHALRETPYDALLLATGSFYSIEPLRRAYCHY